MDLGMMKGRITLGRTLCRRGRAGRAFWGEGDDEVSEVRFRMSDDKIGLGLGFGLGLVWLG
jgi:hypothetical protein